MVALAFESGAEAGGRGSRAARRAQRRDRPAPDGRSGGASPSLEARCRHVCQQRRDELVLLAVLGQHFQVALGSREG